MSDTHPPIFYLLTHPHTTFLFTYSPIHTFTYIPPLQPNEKQMQKKLANIIVANDGEKMLGFNINLTICKQ
jgi:hypothetical protein